MVLREQSVIKTYPINGVFMRTGGIAICLI
jgi:hypothetical protein